MTRYLISFPSGAMDVPDKEVADVVDAAHAVIRAAKDVGAYVFSGGLNDDVEPVRVTGDRVVRSGSHPETTGLDGGFTVVDVPSREAAVEWAARLAAACRCAQEVREFHIDPLA